MNIAIIGGGWAGMTAAIKLQQQGHQLSIFEAARTWGGRARALQVQGPQGQDWTLDNGQHILIGAYSACLQHMGTIGLAPQALLLRTPLDLRYPDRTGLHLPDCRPPFDALFGILRTQGWTWSEKLALLRQAARWKSSAFTCVPTDTVSDICSLLPKRLMLDFVDPLCISALNLPADQASGTVFLKVLQDALFSGRGGSHLLIPRTDLSQLFPASAAQWLQQRGAHLHLGQRVTSLHFLAPSQQWQIGDARFDHIVLATSATEAARLVSLSGANTHHAEAELWRSTAQSLDHTAIGTVYAYQTPASGTAHVLPSPMVALHHHAQAPVQFAFDKGQCGGPAGVLALVASACSSDASTLEQQAIAQARQQLQLPDLQPLKTVIEKRATFACTPGVQRPSHHIAPQLWACGDYVQGPYPATLEAAVRSGEQVAHAIAQAAC